MANLGKALLSTLMILSFITQSISALSAPCPDMDLQASPHSMMHMQATDMSGDMMHMNMDCCDEDSCPMDTCSANGLIFITQGLTAQNSSSEAPLSLFKQTYNSVQISNLYRPPILS